MSTLNSVPLPNLLYLSYSPSLQSLKMISYRRCTYDVGLIMSTRPTHIREAERQCPWLCLSRYLSSSWTFDGLILGSGFMTTIGPSVWSTYCCSVNQKMYPESDANLSSDWMFLTTLHVQSCLTLHFYGCGLCLFDFSNFYDAVQRSLMPDSLK